MTRRWMTVLMVLLALAMLGTTGCIKKKKRPAPNSERSRSSMSARSSAAAGPIQLFPRRLGVRMPRPSLRKAGNQCSRRSGLT